LPDGFHQAAAEIFRRSPHLPDAASDPDLTATVLRSLTGSE
jgi:hypothetical protein